MILYEQDASARGLRVSPYATPGKNDTSLYSVPCDVQQPARPTSHRGSSAPLGMAVIPSTAGGNSLRLNASSCTSIFIHASSMGPINAPRCPSPAPPNSPHTGPDCGH